jgi:hypothetical protein
MKEHRIYTDPRYARLEVHNHGDARFDVLDRKTGKVVESFAGREGVKSDVVSAGFAQRRATAFFERLAVEDRLEIQETAQAARDAEVAKRIGRDFSDEQVINPDNVLDGWEQAQAMEDSPEKAERLQQVRSAAAQLETAAEEVVSRLLV